MKEYHRVSSAGHTLVCWVCRSDLFERRSMTLLTSGVANSGFNKVGQVAVCATCGYVHTFFAGSALTWEPAEAPSA